MMSAAGGRPASRCPFSRRLALGGGLIYIHILLVEALQLIFRLLARVAITLANDSGELIELALRSGEVVIGELAPLFLHLAPVLLPFPGDDVAVHLWLLSYIARCVITAAIYGCNSC